MAAVLEMVKMLKRKPEQENSTVTAIKNEIQGRRSEQRAAGETADMDGRKSDESQPPTPPSPRNLLETQKMISEYIQTSMTDSQKLSPTIWPTEKEYSDAKAKFKYEPGNLHFAVTGEAGTGKSTLINSLRGLRDIDCGAARIGFTETTVEVGRYPHPDKESPLSRIVLYDIPGAGRQAAPSRSEYFNSEGLFIFDFIILVPGDRFMEQDLDILENCKMYNIPYLFARRPIWTFRTK